MCLRVCVRVSAAMQRVGRFSPFLFRERESILVAGRLSVCETLLLLRGRLSTETNLFFFSRRHPKHFIDYNRSSRPDDPHRKMSIQAKMLFEKKCHTAASAKSYWIRGAQFENCITSNGIDKIGEESAYLIDD